MRNNEALAKTRSLKSRINDLRREKLAFEDMLRKLEKTLATQRVDLASALRNVHNNNKARDRVSKHKSAHVLSVCICIIACPGFFLPSCPALAAPHCHGCTRTFSHE